MEFISSDVASKRSTWVQRKVGPLIEYGVYGFLVAATAFFSGCSNTSKVTESPTTTTPSPTDGTSTARYLYVASGQCYSGNGITTFTGTTASNYIYRLSTSTGLKEMQITDYYTAGLNTGDSPISLVDNGSEGLLVLVGNNGVGGGSIDKLAKELAAGPTLYSFNSGMHDGDFRNMVKLSDNALLFSKSTAIEKLTMGKARVTIAGTNPYVSSPGGSCATTATLITALAELGNGNLVYAHAAASPNNKLAIISASGYASAADCKATQAAPQTTTYPTAMVYISSVKQLLVAYGGAAVTTGINSIQVYDMDETTNTFGAPTALYDLAGYPATYPYQLFGISAMTFDPVDNSLYVATAITTATTAVNYAIEKFTYNSTTKTMTRVGSAPFYNYGIDTKCISSLMIGN